MSKKLLAGAELVFNWTSLAGALEGALRFLGDPISTAWLMGAGGLAFRLALPEADGEVAPAGLAELSFTSAALGAQLAKLGRAVEVVRFGRDDPAYARRRDDLVKRVHRSIGRGVPALAFDLHLPQWGLVKGYDDRAGLWYVSTAVSGQFGEALPLARWPVPEGPRVVACVLLGDPRKVDRRTAVMESLRAAIRYAATGEPDDPTGAVHGLPAYERWIDAFAAGMSISAPGNATLVQMLQSARRDAAAFLRGDASSLLPEHAPLLAHAAAAYDAESLALSRMMTLFPFPSGGDPTNPAARLTAASALRDALACERRALAALTEAVGGDGPHPPRAARHPLPHAGEGLGHQSLSSSASSCRPAM